MQPSYDADDFMRRGFFGSLIGFGKKSSSKNEQPPPQPRFSSVAPPPPPPPVVTVPPATVHHQYHEPIQQEQDHHHLTIPQNRTEYDIYREIVTEAEYLERSTPNTPDFSCPTTPQPVFAGHPHPYQGNLPLPPPPPPSAQYFAHHHPQFHEHLMMSQPDMMHHNYHMVMSTIAPHPIPVDTNGVPLGIECPMAPPPYTSFASSSNPQMAQLVQLIPPQQQQQMENLPIDVKREIQEQMVMNGKQQMSIEEIVKLVVVALKDSQIEEQGHEEETPEEILRRKRVQNNLAAARYRKRQREARECAEQELGDLVKRNEDLREQVHRMEREISELKQAVLGPR